MGRKRIKLTCPNCGMEREDTLNNYQKRGHQYCNPCSKMKNFGKDYIGKTYTMVTIISDAEPTFDKKSGKRISMVNCMCSCGKEFVTMRKLVFNGDTKSCGCFTVNRMKAQVGEKNPAYNHNLSIEEREEMELLRAGPKTRIWRKAVKLIGKCVVCGSTEKLVAHHLASFKDNPELRFSVENGVCLCANCHIEYHTLFMGGYSIPATLESFDEFAREKNGE